MNSKSEALAADRRFFSALINADVQALDQILDEDFILIDVLSGSEIAKPEFLGAIRQRQVSFDAIEPADNRIRHFQATSVVTGRTRMRGRVGDEPFTINSRYTHVFVVHDGECRLVTAQGTPIAVSPITK